jgi:hypothetical protein
MLDWLYDCTTYGLCHSAVALEQISSTLLQLSPNRGPPSAVVACRNCVVRSLQLSPNRRLDIRIWIRSLLGSLDFICRAIHRSLILIYRIGEGEKIRTRVWSGTWVWIGVREGKIGIENRNRCFPRGSISSVGSHVVVVVVVYIWNRGTGACGSWSTCTCFRTMEKRTNRHPSTYEVIFVRNPRRRPKPYGPNHGNTSCFIIRYRLA